MKYQTVSWADIANFVNIVNLLKKPYDYVVSIHRGGLPLGVMLSHKITKPLFVGYISLYDNKQTEFQLDDMLKSLTNKSVLLVDDLSDTGRSLELAQDVLRHKHGVKDVDTLCYCYKRSTRVIPTYSKKVFSDDIWVIFPWENSSIPE